MPTKADCVREIKKINARFRKLKKRDGPFAERLRTLKDDLCERLARQCRHLSLVAANKAVFCRSCGASAMEGMPDAHGLLAGVPGKALIVDAGTFRAIVIKRTKQLGINL